MALPETSLRRQGISPMSEWFRPCRNYREGNVPSATFFVKSPNLSWEMGVNLGDLTLEQGVTPDASPVWVFAQAIRVTLTIGFGAVPHRLIASPDTFQTTFPVGFDRAQIHSCSSLRHLCIPGRPAAQ